MTGTVTSFDDARGIGVVTGDDGTEYPFHCAVIADGTRNVEVGAAVRFALVGGHHGRWEAADIVKQ